MKKLAAILKFLSRSSAIWRILRASLIFIVIAAWLFGGFPQIWQNPRIPPGIQEAQAVTFPATSYLSNTASANVTSTVSWQIKTTAPGASDVTTSCKYAKTTGYCQETPGAANVTNAQAIPTAPNGKGWIYDTALNSTIPTGTWTFNIRTTNSAAGGTGVMSVCAWKVKVAAGAITSSTNIINCVDGATNLQANTTSLFVSSVSVTGVATTSLAVDQFLYVEYWLHTTVAGTTATAKLTFEANAGASDDIVLPGASSNLAPNAPSQDSPTNASTSVSVTPTFLMTATDPELNNLGYKVTIYSNSACTTVVQTNDQAVSSAGWTGTNATCTASPTSCYISGTQGSFLTQTALSNSTQYWWKASAKDPDGSGTFTDSTTCNTFTTAAAAPTISCSTNITSTAFGTLSSAVITTSTPNASTTMSCTGTTLGCTLYIKDQGSGTQPGLWNSTSSKLIASPNAAFNATTTLAAGTEGYGIQATTTAAGSGATLTVNISYLQTGNTVGGLTTTTLTIASSTTDASGREVVVTHAAAVSNNTLAGTYNDTITYSCLAN